MSFFAIFRTKKEIVARNYDIAGSGFSPLPSKINENSSDQTHFSWSLKLFKDILSIYSGIFISAIGYGIMMVMISLRLEEMVKNEILISISQATQIIAGIVFSRFLPKLGIKLGLKNTIIFATTIQATSSLLMYFYHNYFLWLAVVFIYGTGNFICGVTRQTIMIDLSPAKTRAIVISIGSMLVAIGNGIGPVFLSAVKNYDQPHPFLFASLFFLTSLIPLSRLQKKEGKIREDKEIALSRYITTSPKIMMAGFCANYSISSLNAFLIIYGIKIGMHQEQASLLLSTLLFGSIFSIPIGYLVDNINRRFLMMVFATSSLFCLYLLYLSQAKIFLLLFINFGCMIGMKLSALVLINDKYKETQRLAVNSAFSKISLTGNVCGIFCTGAIMKILGPSGLWISTIMSLVIFLIFFNFNYLIKFLKKEITFKDLSIFNQK